LFSVAAFRVGHTQLFGDFLRLDASGQSLPGGTLPLRNAFFTPQPIKDDGIEPYLLGLAAQQMQEVDAHVIDDVRSFLFGPPGAGGMDLPALNIQRGREMGLPSYNQARLDVGLPAVTSFTQITSDAVVRTALANIYGTVDKIDVWVGGIAESHAPGALVGPLFQRIIADQFHRSRDSDRFWYENGQFTAAELAQIRGTTLTSLIERNSDIIGLPVSVFTTGTVPAAPLPAGEAAVAPAAEFRTSDGMGNNLADPRLGSTGTNLRQDFTRQYGDGISTPGGADRPGPREISNAVIAQSGSIPNAAGATGFVVFWGQILDHDLSLTPGGVSDTLKILGNQRPGGDDYPFVAEKMPLLLGHTVYPGVNNVVTRPIYLPAIDMQHGTQVDPAQETMVLPSDPALAGASVMVQAGTLQDREGHMYDGMMSITEVPANLTPAALPDNLFPDTVVTIQPADMVFTTPAPLSLPNRAGYPADTIMDLWSINPITGFFDKVGLGKVSPDKSVIETIPGSGGIRNSSWHFFALLEELAKLLEECLSCPCVPVKRTLGSDVNLNTGVLTEAHALPTYQSLGASRGVVLFYDSLRANPQPLVRFSHTVVSVPSGGPDVPEQFLAARMSVKRGDFELQVTGAPSGQSGLLGGEHFWRANAPGEVAGTMMADMRNIPSGRYDFTLTSGLLNRRNGGAFFGTTSSSAGNLINVNLIESPFGAGWGIAGLQELVENPDDSELVNFSP
jgi:hypothetical protein